jgi:anion-transporting  ArsA/GET3 family ATPase
MIVELEKRGERISDLIHELGSLRLVTIAEKPSFEEIKRARDLTNRYIKLEGVHINMIIPEPKKCEFCEKIRALQLNYATEIKKEFKSLKIWQSEKLKEEPIGLDGLRALAYEVYGEKASVDEILSPEL